MNTEQIKNALDLFQSGRDELLNIVTKSAWRIWLTSPDAWLVYMMSNYSPEEQVQISEYVLNDDSYRWSTIVDTIWYVYQHPETIKTMRSMKTMIEIFGAMVDSDGSVEDVEAK